MKLIMCAKVFDRERGRRCQQRSRIHLHAGVGGLVDRLMGYLICCRASIMSFLQSLDEFCTCVLAFRVFDTIAVGGV